MVQRIDSNRQYWLGCYPSARFLHFVDDSLKSIPKHYQKITSYFVDRGVTDRDEIKLFIQKDLLHIAQAFTILFEEDLEQIKKEHLREYEDLIDGYEAKIDHVGRELFGPLSFYLPLLNKMAPKIGLNYLKHIIFPSIQVLKVLQKEDSSLQGLTVARVYFKNNDNGLIKCLELFQASSKDEKWPQKIEFTNKRVSQLTKAKKHSTIIPIDHLSIELNRIEDVKCIHDSIYHRSSDTLMPYENEISFNPADGSLQTKVLLRDSKEVNFNRIVEFVYYLEK